LTAIAGRLCRAGFGLAAVGLLAVAVFPGCGWHSEFVRQGVVLDSLAARNARLERVQQQQGEESRRRQAQMLAEIERIQNEQATVDARLVDLNERMARIGRRLGVWQEVTVPDTAAGPDSAVVPDSTPVVFERGTGVDPDQLYNTAYLDFTRGMYKVAIAGFEQYIQMFPDSDMADNAQYWIGECYYAQGELNRSEEEFRKVLIRYPNGSKVPAATYKLGLVYLAQNREDAARRQFEAVVEKYPGTTEAKLAQERLNR